MFGHVEQSYICTTRVLLCRFLYNKCAQQGPVSYTCKVDDCCMCQDTNLRFATTVNAGFKTTKYIANKKDKRRTLHNNYIPKCKF